MGRIIVSISILVVMAIGCFWTVGYVCKVTDGMISQIDKVEQAFKDGDKELCVNSAKQLRDDWHKFMNYALLVNDLGHELEITSAVAQVYSFAQESNEELYAACDCAQALIEVFKDTQVPTLWRVL